MGTDSVRNVQGRTLQMRGMYRDGQVEIQAVNKGMYRTVITSKRNVMGTDSERNVQGQTLQVRGMHRGQTLHVRGMYRLRTLQVKGMYRGWTLHVRECTDSYLQDRDNTDGHYITLFAEQLTRTFEVLFNV